MITEHKETGTKLGIKGVLEAQRKELEGQLVLLSQFTSSVGRIDANRLPSHEVGSSFGGVVIGLVDTEGPNLEFLYRTGKEVLSDLYTDDELKIAESCFESRFPRSFANRMEGITDRSDE